MCECGCGMRDKKYWFPGPSESYYVLTLSVACVDCDSPPGVTIELIEPGTPMFDIYKQEEYLDGALAFQLWGGQTKGVAVITGMRKHEFVSVMKSHLTGINSKEYSDSGVIDEDGAEVIAEEAYGDSWVQPHIVQPKGGS